MTTNQRKTYRGTLWPAACAAQGWDAKDDFLRQRINYEAAGECSTSAMDQDQLTLLFDHLRWLADPYDFDKALVDSDPSLSWQANRRRQLIWRINATATRRGLTPEYLDTTSRGKCAKYKALTWQDLPLPQLLQFSYTVSSRGTVSASSVQNQCTDDAGPSIVEAARARLAGKSAQTPVKTPVFGPTLPKPPLVATTAPIP